VEPFALDTTRMGLLVVDMQNDFVREGAPQEVPDARVTIPVIASLLEAFRAAGRPVLYTRFTAGPQRTLLWRWSPECGPELRSCWPGELREYRDATGPLEGHAVIDELEPRAGEPVVDKYGYGGFHNTALEGALRAHGVGQVVVTGTVTQICVEETVREGFHRELEIVLVSDGVSSFDPELHAATLRNVAMKFGRVEPAALVLEAVAPAGAAHYTF
jgi:nicotinamidase-related amidase